MATNASVEEVFSDDDDGQKSDEKPNELKDLPSDEGNDNSEGEADRDKGVASGRAASPKKVGKPKSKNKGSVTSTSDESPAKQRKKTPVTHPRTLDMTIEAIEKLNDAKGASFQSIRGWILEKYQTVRPDMIRAMLKTALQQGLDQGLFTRPRGQHGVQLLSGRYRLTKKGEKIAFVIERSLKQAETAKRKAAQVAVTSPVKKKKS